MGEDYGFAFAVGDYVRLKISEKQVVSYPRSWGDALRDKHEVRGVVVSCHLEQCPGGIQRTYSIRWTFENGSMERELLRHNEIELVKSDAFPAYPEEKKECKST